MAVERKKTLEPQRHLLMMVARNMRDVPRIREALGEVSDSPDTLFDRAFNFDQTLIRLSWYLACPDQINSPELCPNLAALREQVGQVWLSDFGIATLSHAHQNSQDGLQDNELSKAISVAEETFGLIANLIASGEWGYVNSIDDLGVLISALLIEGYGLFLEERTGIEGISPIFVRAFEEVLAFDYPKTELWQDVKPWVLEEADLFSPQFVSFISERANNQI